MLKATSKKRRTPAEVRAARAAAEDQERDERQHADELQHMREELAAARQAAEENAAAADLVGDLV